MLEDCHCGLKKGTACAPIRCRAFLPGTHWETATAMYNSGKEEPLRRSHDAGAAEGSRLIPKVMKVAPDPQGVPRYPPDANNTGRLLREGVEAAWEDARDLDDRAAAAGSWCQRHQTGRHR